MFSLFTWVTFQFFWKMTVFSPLKEKRNEDSAGSHATFTVVAIFDSRHIVPEIPGMFVTLSLFYSSIL